MDLEAHMKRRGTFLESPPTMRTPPDMPDIRTYLKDMSVRPRTCVVCPAPCLDASKLLKSFLDMVDIGANVRGCEGRK